MSARKVTVGAYLVSLAVGMPALLLLVGAIASHFLGNDQLNTLCVHGMMIGFGVALLAMAVRAVAGTVWYLQTKGNLGRG